MRYFISILGLVLIVSVGFIFISRYVNVAYGQSSDLVVTGVANDAGGANGAEVLTLLNRLDGINLDGQIFSTGAFKSLQDWGISLTPQAVGRNNPYLPVGNSTSFSVSQSNTQNSGPQFLVK